MAGLHLNYSGFLESRPITIQSKKEGKDREQIQSNITPDLGHHVGK